MQTSDKIQNITTALIQAQTELNNPNKNTEGYGYKYADLSSILDQVKPILQKHGLMISQPCSDDGNGKVGVTTILAHSSGEFIADTLRLPIPEMKGANATQAAGAAITYARRYALSSILNIAADEDTDASSKDVGNKNGSVKASVPVRTKQVDSNPNTLSFICKCGEKSIEKTVTPKTGRNAGQPTQILVCPNATKDNQAEHTRPVWL